MVSHPASELVISAPSPAVVGFELPGYLQESVAVPLYIWTTKETENKEKTVTETKGIPGIVDRYEQKWSPGDTAGMTSTVQGNISVKNKSLRNVLTVYSQMKNDVSPDLGGLSPGMVKTIFILLLHHNCFNMSSKI